MKELQEYLRKGEVLRWQSIPGQFPLLEAGIKAQILRNWVLTVLCAALLLVIYMRKNPEPSMGFVGAVVLVAAVIIGAPFIEYRNLKRQQYFITDQRAIVLTADKSCFYMELKDIDGFEVINGVADSACLAMGKCILPEVRRQLRWQACHPKTDLQSADGHDRALGMVFYAPAELDQAITMLESAGVAAASVTAKKKFS